jgi:hypothetical protein
MLNPDERVQRRRGVQASPLSPGALLVDMDTGRCFELNRVGAEVWGILQIPATCGEIYAQIVDRYRIGMTQAADEVGKLLGQLLDEKLIERGSIPR